MRRARSISISRPPPTGSVASELDSMEVLREILNPQHSLSPEPADFSAPLSDSTGDWIKGSLKDLSTVGEGELPSPQSGPETGTFDQKMHQYNALRTSVRASDELLGQLQSNLQSFGTDLDSLSSEMEVFQTRSLEIKHRLETRKAAGGKLARVIKALIIPPPIVKQLVDKEISPQWRAALNYLVKYEDELAAETRRLSEERKQKEEAQGDEKSKEGSAGEPTGRPEPSNDASNEARLAARKSESTSAAPITPAPSTTPVPPASARASAENHVQLLTYKAIERCRDFITSRIKALRTGTDAQFIQRNFLEYRELFQFLESKQPKLAGDLAQAYINTMRWYYLSNFGRYTKSLEKLPLHVIDRGVLLGEEPTGSKTGTSLFASLVSSQRASTAPGSSQSQGYVNIGGRESILTQDELSAPAVTPQLAEAALRANPTTRYHFEHLYRSLNLAVVSNGEVEFQFLADFFQRTTAETSKMFNQILEPTLAQCHEFTKTYLGSSFDVFGSLICIRLARKFEFDLQKHKVPVLEPYFNLELINLWPRFQAVIDAHCDSLRRASTRSSSFSHAAGAGSSSIPHLTTQHFAMLLSGILTLCPDDSATTEPVANSVVRLRNEFESFLTKISSAIGDSGHRERFLHHNYALVLTVLSGIEGQLARQEQDHFKLLIEAYGQ